MQINCSINKLTEREKKVLYLIAQGYSNQQIALILYFGVDTIKADIKSILKKLSAHNSAEAVGIAFRGGVFKESLIEYFEDKI